jgi:hypothetical protein
MEKTGLTRIPKKPTTEDACLEIMNPIGMTEVEVVEAASRVPDLNRKNVGLFWNSKARGDVALMKARDLLKERFEDLEFSWFKMNNSTALAPEEIAILKDQHNDAVISTTGD